MPRRRPRTATTSGFRGQAVPIGHRKQLEQLTVRIADEQGGPDVTLLDDLSSGTSTALVAVFRTSSTEMDKWVRPGWFIARGAYGAVAPGAAYCISSRTKPSRVRWTP